MATNVSTALPQLSLEEQAILTVDTLDAGAIITSMVIHFTQDVPALPSETQPGLVPFAYQVAVGEGEAA